MTIIIFLLATAVLLLITIPFVMMISELKDLWTNIKFWAVVAAVWAAVALSITYMK